MTSGVALIIASVLFGVNHVAYCRLFNTVEMFGQLALVSEGKLLFYYVGRREIVGLYLTIRLLALMGCYMLDAGTIFSTTPITHRHTDFNNTSHPVVLARPFVSNLADWPQKVFVTAKEPDHSISSGFSLL